MAKSSEPPPPSSRALFPRAVLPLVLVGLNKGPSYTLHTLRTYVCASLTLARTVDH